MLHTTPKQVSLGLLILRVAFAAFMMVHGYKKVMGYSAIVDTFPDPIGIGSQLSLVLTIWAELGCSVLLLVGLFTRLAIIPLAFTMVVALFLVHSNDPWKMKELAAIYLAGYAGLFFAGPGEFSLDEPLRRRKAGEGATE